MLNQIGNDGKQAQPRLYELMEPIFIKQPS